MKTLLLISLFMFLPLTAMSQTETSSGNLSATTEAATMPSSVFLDFSSSDLRKLNDVVVPSEVTILDREGRTRAQADPNLEEDEVEIRSAYLSPEERSRVKLCNEVVANFSAGICGGAAGVRYRLRFGGNQ